MSRNPAARASPYDAITSLYDCWSRSVVEDVPFYVTEARRSGCPVLELAVGTGRIAIPIAEAGIAVIGVDSSEEMLAACRERALGRGVEELVDLRFGDLADPPVSESVPLVICPFRSFLHLRDDDARRHALRSAHDLLVPGGRLVFDVFTPKRDDIAETHGRWLEREPGIFERAYWDTRARTLTLSVCDEAAEATLELAWRSPGEWRTLLKDAGFAVEACYGWFDRTPYEGGEDTVWIASRQSV